VIILTNQTNYALSASDRALLSQQARRFAGSLALRLAHRPWQAFDVYLAGLNAIPGILERYIPGDTMGFLHAIDLPLRNAMVSAAVALSHAPAPNGLPDTLRRFLQTGHIL